MKANPKGNAEQWQATAKVSNGGVYNKDGVRNALDLTTDENRQLNLTSSAENKVYTDEAKLLKEGKISVNEWRRDVKQIDNTDALRKNTEEMKLNTQALNDLRHPFSSKDATPALVQLPNTQRGIQPVPK